MSHTSGRFGGLARVHLLSRDFLAGASGERESPIISVRFAAQMQR